MYLRIGFQKEKREGKGREGQKRESCIDLLPWIKGGGKRRISSCLLLYVDHVMRVSQEESSAHDRKGQVVVVGYIQMERLLCVQKKRDCRSGAMIDMKKGAY